MMLSLAPEPPLDASSAVFKEMMAEATSFLAAFLDQLPQSRASNLSAAEAQAFLADPRNRALPAEHGRPLTELLATIGAAAQIGLNTAGGGYLAFIPGSGLVTAALADLISGVLNRYTGIAAGAPALVAFELDIIRWLARMMGLPDDAGGILTSGASIANLSALLCAKAAYLPDDFRAGTIYATDQAHHCIAKAARLAGFPKDALRLVPTDDRLRMDANALRLTIASDRAQGRQPFCIVANAGSTNTGTIDPLDTIADIAQAHRLWFHVDAAYGGFFRMTDRGRQKLSGIERADSVVLDPHKGLFLPFGTGCLLVRDSTVLQRAHAGDDAAYLQDLEDALVNFADNSLELTRPNRGLRLWLPLHLHGTAAFRSMLDEKIDLAEEAHRALCNIPQISVFGPPDLSIVAFRSRLPQGAAEGEDRATTELTRQVNAEGRVFLSTTRIGGRVMARIAVLNHRTKTADIRAAVDAIRRAASVLSRDAAAVTQESPR
ncbi:MAG TPA: aminotransferase class V-fold PLP-dependent enzyme [Dongiaceae bacterium]|nr:aminotransferase class V-fold PLP-dependent enzyme [Dongiaceae bacterium]